MPSSAKLIHLLGHGGGLFAQAEKWMILDARAVVHPGSREDALDLAMIEHVDRFIPIQRLQDVFHAISQIHHRCVHDAVSKYVYSNYTFYAVRGQGASCEDGTRLKASGTNPASPPRRPRSRSPRETGWL